MKYRHLYLEYAAIAVVLLALGGISVLLLSPAQQYAAAELDAMANPAAVYCGEVMGYGYLPAGSDKDTHEGSCLLPDETVCEEWDFLTGKCGVEYNYCGQNGYDTIVKTDGQNTFTSEYAVCVEQSDSGSDPVEVGSVTDLVNLSDAAKSVGCSEEKTAALPPEPGEGAVVQTAADLELGDSYPSSFDWRNVSGTNWMTPVRDQGQCGSCWAFSTMGVTEGTLNIAANNPGLDPDLSEQYLVSDCLTYHDCCGGSTTYSMNYMQSSGAPDEGCMVYVDGSGCSCYGGTCDANCTYSSSSTCSDRTCSQRCADYATRLTQINSYVDLTNNEAGMKEYLSAFGPLTMSYGAGSYWGGYFDANNIYRCTNDTGTDHAVTVVGYNDAGGYWIIKNSWGTSYQDSGYFKLGYGECYAGKRRVYGPSVTPPTPPPANDDFDSPYTVSPPYSHMMDVTNTTSAGDDPSFSCVSGSKYKTVWYKYTATTNDTLHVSTLGSTYDTVLAVYTGSRGSLTSRACNDDYSGYGLQSKVQLSVTPGTTYYIEVASYWSSGEDWSNLTIGAWLENEMDKDTTGVFRPSNGWIYLKNRNVTGYADQFQIYGIANDLPVAGDWDGDGVDSIGVFRNGTFYLRNDPSACTVNCFADVIIPYGSPYDWPVAGDWDKDGIDEIGVYRSGTFYLVTSNTNASQVLPAFGLGIPGDMPIGGDWDGDGRDTVGVFRPSNGWIYLKNSNTTGYADQFQVYGVAGDRPLAGDWDDDGVDSIGVYRSGMFYLRNDPGACTSNCYADKSFALGNPGDWPIGGDWDGLP